MYGQFSNNLLSKWLFSYRKSSVLFKDEGYNDSIFDWPDINRLPKGIVSLDKNILYICSHVQTEKGDFVGYLAHNNHDSEDKAISSLQEFLHVVSHSLNKKFEINVEHYSILNGITLFQM